MKVGDIIQALRRMKVETGSLMCMGCNDERNCGIHGCVIMNMAADRLANDQTHIAALQKEIEQLRSGRRWIPVTERLPENFQEVLCWYEYFRYGDFNAMFETYGIGYQINGSWGGEASRGTKARVLAWMPLPNAPEVKV